jgi:hypothetical protein
VIDRSRGRAKKEVAMNGNFTTEIGRLRVEEMVTGAARYHELARSRREHDRRDSVGTKKELPRVLRYLYARALKIAALSILFLSMLATAALAIPAGPGRDPQSGNLGEGGSVTQVPVADGGMTPLFWTIIALVAASAGIALLFAWTRRIQRPA